MNSTTTKVQLNGLDVESRQMVLDAVKQCRKRLLPKEKILELDRQEIFPEEIIREMTGPEYGLQLLFIPENCGGMGGGARDACALVRDLSAICLGVSTGFFALQLGVEPILGGGTEEQKLRWLGRLAEGNCLVAYAVTEAGAGSNLAALKTKADPVTNDAGEVVGYTMNGSKQFISTGGYADFLTVLARTPEGPTFFVVEKGTDGFTAGKPEEKHGIRASNTSALTFEDVYVPVENMIGEEPGQGLIQAGRVFGYTRVMVGAMALGAGESALGIVIPYAKERVQFGTPLSEKQGYTHKLIVPNAVRLEAASVYIDETATRLDAGEGDMQVEGSIAKYFATESADRTANDGIQALGGYGYINEYEIEKIKRDLKITCIYEGTSEIQQNIISTFRWKKTRKTKGDYYGSLAAEMEEVHAQQADLGAVYYGLAARALNETIFFVQEHGLVKKQYFMFALADMMTHVEVGIALVRKARGLIEAADADADRVATCCRIFAADVAQLTANNMMKVLSGAGTLEDSELTTVLEQNGYFQMLAGVRNVVNDMDHMADLLFDR